MERLIKYYYYYYYFFFSGTPITSNYFRTQLIEKANLYINFSFDERNENTKDIFFT